VAADGKTVLTTSISINALVPLVLAVTVILFSSEVSLGSRFA